MSLNLADKSMLVTLKRSMFTANTHDKTATEIVEKTTSTKKTGRYKKVLFAACNNFKAVNDAYRDLYNYHVEHTLPWEDRGARLLPSAMFMEYSNAMAGLGHKCDTAVKEFIASYPQSIHQEKTILGTLFNIEDYPRAEAMMQRWGYKLVYQPVPSSNDFRIPVSEEIKQALDEALVDRVAQAKQHIVTELTEPLKRAVERLSSTDGVFRDTLISNIVDAANRMTKLAGLADDPELTQLVEKAKHFADTLPSPKALRTASVKRERTAEESQKLIDDFSALYGGI